MSQTGLTNFIVEYVAGRRQAKLDAFDKDAAKRLAAAGESERIQLEGELLQKRRELELRYEPRAWLTDAANRAGQISLVTHAAKFTHGDSKSSSIFTRTTENDGYLSTATLKEPATDVVGNAAALDVATLLRTEIDGDSLLNCLMRKDYKAMAALAGDEMELGRWVAGLSRVITTKAPLSHKLTKEVYFPVANDYHLISPIFSSSLAHALRQRLVKSRFSDESKVIWKARREGKWHSESLTIFPQTAVMSFCSNKPQTRSLLNVSWGGRVWLLSAAAPQWETQVSPPLGMKTLFGQGPFERSTRPIRRRLTDLLIKTGDDKNYQIRRARDRYIDEIIDILFSIAADIQRLEWAGWTQDEKCTLKPHQRLWLDPWRAKTDDAFCQQRDKGDWQDLVAEDFALWLNAHLRRAELSVGKTEKTQWQTKPLFSRRLREMEQAIRRYRHE